MSEPLDGGGYLVAIALVLLALAGPAVFARASVRALLGRPDSARAVLAQAVVATTAILVPWQVAGAFGAFGGPAILVSSALLFHAGLLLDYRLGPQRPAGSPAGPASPAPRIDLLGAGAAVAVLASTWIAQIASHARFGYGEFDSLAYHLPIAQHFQHGGSTTDLAYISTESAMSVYPHGVELLLAGMRMAFDGDAFLPAFNLAWLGLLLLAAWVIGTDRGRGAMALAVAAAALSLPALANLDAGSAKNNIFGLAFLLAAVAFLPRRGQPDPREPGARVRYGSMIVGGLAAGLAAGARVNLLPVVALLPLAVFALRPVGDRAKPSLVWTGSTAITGSFWYLRNVWATGSPLPLIDLPGLPGWNLPVQDRLGTNLLDASGQPGAWGEIADDLVEILGPLWPVTLVLAAGAVGWALWAGGRARMVGLLALVGVAGYAVTPFSLTGLEGEALLFGSNFRLGLIFPAVAAIAAAGQSRSPSSRSRLRRQLVALRRAGFYLVLLLVAASPWIEASLDRYEFRARLVVLAAAALALMAAAALGRRAATIGTPEALMAAGAIAAIGLLAALAPGAVTLDERQRARLATSPPAAATRQAVAAGQVSPVAEDEQVVVAGDALGYVLSPFNRDRAVQQIGAGTRHGQLLEPRTCAQFSDALAAANATLVMAADASPYAGELDYGRRPLPYAGWLDEMGAARLYSREGDQPLFVYAVDPATLSCRG